MRQDQPMPARPVTGDRDVDEILQSLDEALAADPEAQVGAVAEAHRRLQARLTAPAQPNPPHAG